MRPALEAESYEEANRLHSEATGHGLSRQSFALTRKILELDAILRGAQPRGDALLQPFVGDPWAILDRFSAAPAAGLAAGATPMACPCAS